MRQLWSFLSSLNFVLLLFFSTFSGEAALSPAPISFIHFGSQKHWAPPEQWPLAALSGALWHTRLQFSSANTHGPVKEPDRKSAATSSTTLTLAFRKKSKLNPSNNYNLIR
jgi:hypothetical protein